MAKLSPVISQISGQYQRYLFILFCMVMFSEVARAKQLTDQQKLQVRALGHVSMCVEPNWLPFEAINNDGEYVGVLADYAELISLKLGLPFVLHPTASYYESLQALKAGVCDFIVADVATEQKLQDYLATEPYFISHRALATHVDAPFVDDLVNLGDETIGVLANSPAAEVIPKLYPHLTVQTFESTEEGLKKVESRELFGFVSVLGSLVYVIQDHHITNVKIGGVLPSNAKLSMLVNKNRPELVGLFNIAINDISPLERKEIFERWFPVRYETGIDWGLFWSVIFAIFICSATTIGLFYYWNLRLKQEIRRRLEAEEKITELAMTDPLTKLANRIRFSDDLKLALHAASLKGRHVALAILDLDDFKPVNDLHGHPIGDECLRIVAGRLLKQCREQDTVARLGGDEFAIIYNGPESRDMLPDIAQRLIEAVGKPIYVDDIEIQVGLSIGFAVFPDHSIDSDGLVRLADEALYEAKDMGKNKFRIFEPDSVKKSERALGFERKTVVSEIETFR
ncbi:hypothetical protein D515_00860 [Grimontia indica]|uniref:GGDEF domain-containing protein n=1 Tax=Grimontia indica TaxID=1056512 RepID=R1GV40_9GAMM|nr:diguanylate cyclase [Grimontia indica]EOD80038.1 hypothetical protein D515_00860 [Grimontia indica]